MVKIKLGVVPVRRDMLSLEKAAANKQEIFARMAELIGDDVEIVDIDDICEQGILVADLGEIDRVVAKMKTNGIDGLFMPHCDFGMEESIGRVARALNVPVLLWGPRDKGPGTYLDRGTDVQCGLFVSSKALVRLNIPFSYIVNCWTDSKQFTRGFQRFLATVAGVKAFRNLRILKVGERPRPFQSVMLNEDELMTKFGVSVIPVSVLEIVHKIEILVKDNLMEVAAEAEEFRNRMRCNIVDDEGLVKLAALKMVLLKEIEQYNCHAVAIDCWTFIAALKVQVCCDVADLTDLGIPVACENDVLGAMTSVMLNALVYGEAATFFADLTVRHPENDNAELLWHCGPFPQSLMAESCKPNMVMGTYNWELKRGGITVARIAAQNGRYTLFAGEGKAVDGPEASGTFVWLEVDDWDKWEEKLIFGPYIHHVSCVYGNYERVLAEIVKYIPGLEIDGMSKYRASL